MQTLILSLKFAIPAILILSILFLLVRRASSPRAEARRLKAGPGRRGRDLIN
jgi:hypothetical protein